MKLKLNKDNLDYVECNITPPMPMVRVITLPVEVDGLDLGVTVYVSISPFACGLGRASHRAIEAMKETAERLEIREAPEDSNAMPADMRERKHTKGPWRVVETGRRIEVMAEGVLYPIAHIHRAGRSVGVNYRLPVEANAKLMAAAPDLLDALEDLVVWHAEAIEATLCGTLRVQTARAAIRKATEER